MYIHIYTAISNNGTHVTLIAHRGHARVTGVTQHWECRLGVWFGFVGAALLPAVSTCVVLAFGAMPGRCCFLRVPHIGDAVPENGGVADPVTR